jgi:hypothetical protein
MKAIVQNAYGASEVLRLAEVEKPQAKAGQALVRVHATRPWAMPSRGTCGERWSSRFPEDRRPSSGLDLNGVGVPGDDAPRPAGAGRSRPCTVAVPLC